MPQSKYEIGSRLLLHSRRMIPPIARILLMASLSLWVVGPAPAVGAASTPEPGEIPPDQLGRSREGAVITVSQHRGKVVVVTFWASWCPPCRQELPKLSALQNAVGREHLEVIAVNFKEPKRAFNEVIRINKGVTLTYVHDARGQISDSYGVTALPTMFIIDRDGRIAHVHRGYSDESLRPFIKEMVALLPPNIVLQVGEKK